MPNDKQIITLEAGKGADLYWNDLWRYRELFFFLAWRDVLVRYKQTAIGVLWSFIRPLLTMIVFTLVFSKLAHLPSYGVPYSILVYSALLPWQFFASAFSDGSNSLLSNSNLLSKVYFPRLILPASTLLVNFIDFLISCVILAGLMVWYRYLPPIQILLLPVFIVYISLISLGAAFWISALNVKFRDFKYIVPFVLQFGLYISPVGFSSKIIPEKWQLLYALNPMAGVIEGFRWIFLGNRWAFPSYCYALSLCLTLLVFVSGIWFFRKMEKSFADII
jgi:lipopolysaccharide transport system permease protein